jgi:triacylglycerol lipase
MATMALWLRRIGYCPYLSGIDWNVGCPARKIELLGWRAERIVDESKTRLVVVGHSLGGLLARSIAVRFPARIRHVVTLGTPSEVDLWAVIRAEWRPTLRLFQMLWRDVDPASAYCGTSQCPCDLALSASAFSDSVGLTSIYTRSDEVIDWRSCMDTLAENHEVSGGHLSLHVNRHVYRLLAVILASGEARGLPTAEPPVHANPGTQRPPTGREVRSQLAQAASSDKDFRVRPAAKVRAASTLV